jgi:hypothetical protein
MKIFACVWCRCRICKAPVTRPTPDGWTYTIVRRRSGIHRVTPHREGCPSGFRKVLLPDDDDVD